MKRPGGFHEFTGHLDDAYPDGLNLHGLLAVWKAEGAQPVRQIVGQQTEHHFRCIDPEGMAVHLVHPEAILGFFDVVLHRTALVVNLDDILWRKGITKICDEK